VKILQSFNTENRSSDKRTRRARYFPAQ